MNTTITNYDDNIINDDFIIKLLFNEKEHLNINYVKQSWLNIHTNIKEYLEYRFIDSESLKETLYRILCKIEKRPACKICGSKVSFESGHRWCRNRNGWPFLLYCSSKCQRADNDVTEKRNKTNIERYGSSNPSTSKVIKEKIKRTNLQKYGVENVFGNKKIQEKIKQTIFKKYGVSSLLSNLDDVHVENLTEEQAFNINKVKEKIRTTNFKKYGAKSYAQSQEFKTLYSLNINDYIRKQYETKKHNNSFNISKKEDKIFNIIQVQYPNVKRQVKTFEYPYAADFFIEELDMYIEYNGTWTHGTHPFDKTNKNDIEQVLFYKNKSINSKYYKNAIYTWTILDVKKLHMIKQNNIKMLIVYNNFNINEINDVIHKFSKSKDRLLIVGTK